MKATKGFTIVELLAVVTIIAILAAVAIPQYNDYVTRGKIAEAVSALSDARVKAEQFFQDNRSYTSASLAANNCPTTMPVPASTTYFTYACSNLSATTYTITATGTGSMLGFTYTIDQNNAKATTAAPVGWAAASMPTTCWIKRKSGGC
jgi:type IV pilus assembly protein PilE